MVTWYGQADIPREVNGRRADHRSTPAADFQRDVCLTVSRNHKVFLLSSTYKQDVETEIVALMVLWGEKSGDFMTNYLPIHVWRHQPSEAWSPKARAFTSSISQGLHMAHKKPEYKYGFIPSLLVKKIASKSPVYLSIDTLLSPSLRIVWEFLSGPCVLRHCSNERLEYYAARDEPLWHHNGFSDVVNAQSQQIKRAHP